MRKRWVWIGVAATALVSVATFGPDLDKQLFQATRNRSIQKVKLLLEQGANPNASEAGGYSVLDLALMQNSPQGDEIASHLLHRGAKPKKGDSGHMSSIGIAAFTQKKPGTLRPLIKSGANVNDLSWEGGSPLSLTLLSSRDEGRVNALELLRLGASPNIGRSDRRTPLMLAVKNCSFDLVKQLVKRGADIRATREASKPSQDVLYLAVLVKDRISKPGYLPILKLLTDKLPPTAFSDASDYLRGERRKSSRRRDQITIDKALDYLHLRRVSPPATK